MTGIRHHLLHRLVAMLALALVSTESRAELDAILGGAAAMTAVNSQVAVAGIQAEADVKIAKINARTAVEMTDIQSETSKYLADTQAQIAKGQAMVSAEVNADNQQSVTERLGMQLSELASARRDAYQAQREAMAIDKEYNDARIRIAEKEADAKVALAREQSKMQLTMAGLQTGTGYAQAGGKSSLSIKRNYGPNAGLVGSGIDGAGATATASAEPAAIEGGTAEALASANPAQSSGMRMGVQRTPRLLGRTPRGSQPRAGASARLLSSSARASRGTSALGSALRGAAAERLSAAKVASAGKLLPSLAPQARGSFRGDRVRIAMLDQGVGTRAPSGQASVGRSAQGSRAVASISEGGRRHSAGPARGVASGGHSHGGHSH